VSEGRVYGYPAANTGIRWPLNSVQWGEKNAMFPVHGRTFDIVSGFNYYIFVVNEGNPPRDCDDQIIISVGAVYNDVRSLYTVFSSFLAHDSEEEV